MGAQPSRAEPGQSGRETYLIHMTFFLNAKHHVSMGQRSGPVHGHSWRIDLRLGATFRDGQGEAPIEFAELDQRGRDILRDYEGKLLNEMPPFDRVVPTTENVGRFLFGRLGDALGAAKVHLISVSIWEAPTKGVTVSTPLPVQAIRPQAEIPRVAGSREVVTAQREAAAAAKDERPDPGSRP